MSPGMSPQRQADLLKDRGNVYYKREKLGAAIDAYTEAITLCPGVPVYWTNRAICERKRNEWEKVENDCRKALELDSQSVKAYYMLGLALLQYQQYEEAIKQLEKALDLGRGAIDGNYIVEEIWQELSKARLAEWKAVSDIRQRQQWELKMHLSNLLRDDYQRQLNGAIASIKATAAATSFSGSAIQVPSQEGVEDLIRLDSGSNNATDKEAETVINRNAQFLPLYTDVELERLYRTYSEPPKDIRSEEDDAEEGRAAFDPLKHHKLSLRRSSSRGSIRRQQSQQISIPNETERKATVPAGGSRRGVSPPAPDVPEVRSENSNSVPKTLREESRPNYGPAPVAATTVSVENTSAAGSGGSETSNFHSIYDVFKVFKEFMKLKNNEEGQKLLRISELHQRRSKVLEDVFERVAAPDIQVEIPDHLCCKITMDIFRDPVLTPSGITYERAAVMDHLCKVGQFDPYTRAPLTKEQIFPNLALKEAVQAYLNEHGWAYGPC